MWFLGLIVGAVVGSIGGGTGAFLGALVGAVVGWALASRSDHASADRLRETEESIRKLAERVSVLERGSQPAAAPMVDLTAAVAPEPRVSETAVPDAASSAVEPAQPAVPAPETAPPPVPMPEAQQELPEPSAEGRFRTEARRSTAGIQWIGIIIGAALGGLVGGIGVAVIGGFIGWVIAMIVIANRGLDAAPRPERAGAEGHAHVSDQTPGEPEVRAAVPSSEPEWVPPTDVEVPPAATAQAPMEIAAESGPGWLRRLVGGNIVATIGVVVLFFGVGFLLKFAYDRGMLPLQLRLAGVAAFGLAMLVTGWRLQDTRRLYGLILQGGGIGLLYLDVYFALRIYGLIEVVTGFAAFMTLGVAATLLAVRQDAKILAVLGLTGAFLAPVLARAETENHVLLFSYYTLLNGFILTISWFKAWRDLNLIGFFFTFVVGLLWGARNYRPDLFASVEPFVLIFFAMYLVIPILFAQRQPPELKGLVDGTLVFGTPMAVAFMQSALVKDLPYGLAWSAGCACFLYALLAATTIRREQMRLLGETYVALSVVFLTLAIFFALDAYPTFALWTLEGAALVWIGLRQRRLLARLAGLALQLAGTFYFVIRYSDYRLANPWFNDFVLGCAIIAAAGFITAWLLHRYRDALKEGLEPGGGVLVAWAGLWWATGGVHSLYHAYAWPVFFIALLAFTAATFAVVELIGTRLQWTDLRRLSHAHLPVLFSIAAMLFLWGEATARGGPVRPLAHGGYWAWPLNFAILFWASRSQVRDGILPAGYVRQTAAWCLAAALATWDALWLLAHRNYWGVLAWGGAGMSAAAARFWWGEQTLQDAARHSAWVLVWGVVWWFAGGAGLVDRHVAPVFQTSAHLAFAAATFLAAEWLGRRLRWDALRAVTAVHVPVMIGILILTSDIGAQPLAGARFIAWPASFLILYWSLHRQRQDAVAIAHDIRYAAGWILIGVVATWEVIWELSNRHHAGALGWSALGMMVGYARYRLRERNHAEASPTSMLALAWGMGFWYVSGFAWIDSEFTAATFVAATLGFVAISCAAFESAGSLGAWPILRRTAILLPAAMVTAAMVQFADRAHPFAGYAWMAWLAAFVTLYAALVRQERAGVSILVGVQHAVALWLGTVVLTWEIAWQIDAHRLGSSWWRAAWSAIPAIVLAWVSACSGRVNWPFGVHYPMLYRGAILMPIAALTLLWSVYTNLVAPGSMAPLPYLPLLNPIDLAQAAVLFAIWRWCGTFEEGSGLSRTAITPYLAGLAFLWVNCIALRSIHFWAGVEYRFDELMDSVLVQAVFSLLWTTTALVLMVHATRSAQRGIWIVGAVLLGVVVVKLFLLDLANSGTVERIVSFIGVGIGLLAVGYLAPVPPGEKEQ